VPALDGQTPEVQMENRHAETPGTEPGMMVFRELEREVAQFHYEIFMCVSLYRAGGGGTQPPV
jgi:hypothetical protein